MATTAKFFALLEKSNLLAPDELAKAHSINAASPKDFAKGLVQQGLLTKWQAQQLLAGRHQFFLGKYKLLDKLGEGGFGAVYKAEQHPLKRIVALKVISDKALTKPKAVQRFHREIRSVAALNHPNIIAAFDADSVGTTHFLVMEYVEGKDLKTWIKSYGRLPIDWSCECVRQAALGLQHAYEANIVHRDIKPSNLLVVADETGGLPQIKILDMGLARFTAEAQCTVLTQTGMCLGTIDYISPEQAQDTKGVDIRADIFSLGATLFHCLTGEAPYTGKNPMEKLMARAMKDAPRASSLREELPRRLDTIIAKMLEREPNKRFNSPLEVAEALEPYGAGEEGDRSSSLMMPATVNSETIDEEEDRTLQSFLNVLASEAEQTDEGVGDKAESESRNVASSKRRLWIGGGAVAALLLLVGSVLNFPSKTPLQDEGDLPNKADGLIATLPDGAIDLLSLINLDRDAVRGNWKINNGVLESATEPRSLLRIPYSPKTPYRFDFEIKRNEGALNVSMVLRVVDRKGFVRFDDEQVRFGAFYDSEKTVSGAVHRGQPLNGEGYHLVSCTVFPHRVLVTCDGKPLIVRHGTFGSLHCPSGMDIEGGGQLYLYVGHAAGTFSIRKMTLTPLSPDDYAKPPPPDNYALRFGRGKRIDTPITFDDDGPYTIECFVVKEPNSDVGEIVRYNRVRLIAMGRKARLYRNQAGFYVIDHNQESFISTNAQDGTQHHVAVVFRNGKLMLFVDGQLKGTEPYTAYSNPMQTEIAGGHLGLAATLDEIRISSVARYTEDFTPPDRFESDEHTELLYHFDEGFGNYVADASPYGRHGIIHGKPQWVKSPFRKAEAELVESRLAKVADQQLAEWIVENGGRVRVAVTEELPDWIDDPTELPSEPFQVIHAIFPSVTDDSVLSKVAELSETSHDRYFTLNETQITDNGLRHLLRVPNLHAVSLANTNVSDDGMAELKKSRINNLIVSHTDITDAGIAHLSKSSLVWLDCSDTHVTNDGLKHLTQWRGYALRLRNVEVTDEGLKFLHSLKSLRSLVLSGSPVSAEGVHELREALPNCKVTWTPSEPNRRAAEWVLSIGGKVEIQVGGETNEIAKAVDLPILDFSVTKIDVFGCKDVFNEDATRFKDLDSLTQLRLGNTEISDKFFEHAVFPDSLTTIWLRDNEITDKGIESIARIKSIKEIGISNGKVTDKGVALLARRKDLVHLNLQGNPITDEAVRIISGCADLNDLVLSDAPITDSAIDGLVRLQKLHWLFIENTKISQDGFERLKKALPNTKIKY